MSSSYTFTVSLTDVNDIAPYCSSSLFSASLAERLKNNGDPVAQITCTDADSSSPNNDIASFEFNPDTAGK